MKKYISIAIIVTLLVLLSACSQQPAQSQTEPASETVMSQEPSSATETVSQPPAIIEFNDKTLEAAIRKAMNKLEGGITSEEAAQVVSLNLNNASFDDMNSKNGGIKDIGALQNFTGLTELDISFNQLSDLTPLSKLTQLETLVFNGTLVEDLSPLKDLGNIKCLVFCWVHGDNGIPKGIGNLDVLSNLTKLEMIDAKNAGIKDISSLSNLPVLWEVQLNDNMITDVSPLAKVKKLRILLLEGNPVKDFSPLKDVYGQLEGKDFEIK